MHLSYVRTNPPCMQKPKTHPPIRKFMTLKWPPVKIGHFDQMINHFGQHLIWMDILEVDK